MESHDNLSQSCHLSLQDVSDLMNGEATAIYLFYSGTFNPCHAGHFDVGVQSYYYFNNQTYNQKRSIVVGVYFSPSHPAYCQDKLKENALDIHHRLILLDIGINATNSSFGKGAHCPFFVDTMESTGENKQFDVLLALFHTRVKSACLVNEWKKFEVVCLAGSDLIPFIEGFYVSNPNMSFAFVLNRGSPSASSKSSSTSSLASSSSAVRLDAEPNVHFIVSDFPQPLSSTSIRDACLKKQTDALFDLIGIQNICTYILCHQLFTCTDASKYDCTIRIVDETVSMAEEVFKES